MVPGQVISREIITFMRKLDVKEIHGYHAAAGLKLLKPDALAARQKTAGRADRAPRGAHRRPRRRRSQRLRRRPAAPRRKSAGTGRAGQGRAPTRAKARLAACTGARTCKPHEPSSPSEHDHDNADRSCHRRTTTSSARSSSRTSSSSMADEAAKTRAAVMLNAGRGNPELDRHHAARGVLPHADRSPSPRPGGRATSPTSGSPACPSRRASPRASRQFLAGARRHARRATCSAARSTTASRSSTSTPTSSSGS